MKITIRRTPKGLEAYVPKKDLETRIIAQELDSLWGGWIDLSNGWRFQLPALPADTRMPITLDAPRIDTAEVAT
ncbi:MAG: putative nitrogen fixation protein NifT [Alphaproteobacteria bacterium]|nr:putative nitrogen fixation protein NifT [Alphaproteobacteria bacterium]TAD90408.1 MAG: putative nitrogen fixation protein NifT [Alphaproteobacteria bacterium]